MAANAPGKKTVYKDNTIHIEYNSGEQWLEVDWTGFQNLNTVKKGCMVMLDIVRQYKCKKVLNDNTHVKGTWSEAAEWGANEWVPAMYEAGVRYFAWIYSPSTFSRMSADKAMTLAKEDIFNTFDNREEAAAWLRTVGERPAED